MCVEKSPPRLTTYAFPNREGGHRLSEVPNRHPTDRNVNTAWKLLQVPHSPRASKPLTSDIFGQISRYNCDFEAHVLSQNMSDRESDNACSENDNMSLRHLSWYVQEVQLQ